MGKRVLVLFAFAATTLAGCGGTAAGVVPQPPRPTRTAATIEGAAASCAGLTPQQQLAAARLVFVGRFLAGPTSRVNNRSVLVSPARLRVGRYIKGHGPPVVRVATAVTARGAIAEDGVDPQPGERWRIYTDSKREPYATSTCGGSRRAPS